MTTTETARSVTDRGFTVYDQFTDTYGNDVRVQESSAASGPRCWIFATHDRDRWLGPREQLALRQAGFADLDALASQLSPSPHLDIAQAERVRDALDAFIREAKETAKAENDFAADLGPEA